MENGFYGFPGSAVPPSYAPAGGASPTFVTTSANGNAASPDLIYVNGDVVVVGF